MTQENVQNWSVETWTVDKFMTMKAFIDLNPLGQRLETSSNPIGESKPSKAQGIIDSMLRQSDIGEIKIVRTPDSAYPYESVDGGHRKRAIRSLLTTNSQLTKLHLSVKNSGVNLQTQSVKRFCNLVFVSLSLTS